ncbi:MAG: sulfotransferase family protein [Pseudomonadota bacterium]
MPKRFRVFGLGLNKTGTSSLRQALKILGFRHHIYRPALIRDLAKGRMAPIFAAAEASESFEDWPWPLVWRQLDARFGDGARFVLTRRISADVWLESLKAHSARTAGGGFARRLAYGHAYPHGQEAAHLAVYDAHLAALRTYFADRARAHRFIELCWEEGQGWSELCTFLGEPLPDLPFPHANAARAETRVEPPFLNPSLDPSLGASPGPLPRRAPDPSPDPSPDPPPDPPSNLSRSRRSEHLKERSRQALCQRGAGAGDADPGR